MRVRILAGHVRRAGWDQSSLAALAGTDLGLLVLSLGLTGGIAASRTIMFAACNNNICSLRELQQIFAGLK